MPEPICVNPNLSLLELVSIKNTLKNKLKYKNLTPAMKAAYKRYMKNVELKIRDLKDSASTPGQCIRIM